MKLYVAYAWCDAALIVTSSSSGHRGGMGRTTHSYEYIQESGIDDCIIDLDAGEICVPQIEEIRQLVAAEHAKRNGRVPDDYVIRALLNIDPIRDRQP